MRLSLRASAAAALIAFVAPAGAQPLSGLYLGLGAGANWREEAASLRFINPIDRTTLRTAVGPALLGSVGWGFGNGLRLELGGSWRQNEVSGFRGRSSPGAFSVTLGAGGRTDTAALMANVFYDVDVRRWDMPVMPYVGVGIGVGWRSYDNAGGISEQRSLIGGGSIPITRTDERRSGTQAGFAWQVAAGLATPIAAVPGLSLALEYRHFSMPRVRYDLDLTLLNPFGGPGALPSIPRMTNSDDNRHHAVMIGLRYALGTPR
jgi:opacity protein-like surface antigen